MAMLRMFFMAYLFPKALHCGGLSAVLFYLVFLGINSDYWLFYGVCMHANLGADGIFQRGYLAEKAAWRKGFRSDAPYESLLLREKRAIIRH